jgi:hypothetical protein
MPAHRLIALLLAAAACGGDDFTPTLDDPWRPGSPGDVDCTSACEDVADIDDPHLGPMVLFHDPTATDGTAQFGDCARSVLACWTGDADLATCVAASVCPAPCRAEYARVLDGATDLEAQTAAVDTVFLDDGARCGPPAAGEVSP